MTVELWNGVDVDGNGVRLLDNQVGQVLLEIEAEEAILGVRAARGLAEKLTAWADKQARLEEAKAREDAAIHGSGFLVKQADETWRCVHPELVRVFTAPVPAAAPVPAGLCASVSMTVAEADQRG